MTLTSAFALYCSDNSKILTDTDCGDTFSVTESFCFEAVAIRISLVLCVFVYFLKLLLKM